MRKLVVSMNITLDGFISGIESELDWHFQNWSSDMANLLSQELGEADTIVLGRSTYDAMSAYWPIQSDCPSFPREDIAFAEMMNSHTKLVFSTSIRRAHWRNSRILRGDVASEIIKLKKLEGKNMIIYGSGKLVKTLSSLNLIDEYLLWIHPVLIGEGVSLFKENIKKNFSFVDGRTFDSGVVALRYRITQHQHI